MASNSSGRMRAETALFNAWIRRRWKPLPHADRAFVALEDFCNCSLVKRLFGRFLVQFLDAAHMMKVSEAFYSLDSQGYGSINVKALLSACKSADRHTSAITTITSWMCNEGVPISLARFAESMAEEVIDGRALRHSFESLDDDGSECITAKELFLELKGLCSDLKIEDINAHMEIAEVGVASGESDHKLDYYEYMRLFPGRMRQVKAIEERIASTRAYAIKLETEFETVKEKVKAWIKSLDVENNTVSKLQSSLTPEGSTVYKDLKKRLTRVAHLLAHPPGPVDLDRQAESFQVQKKSKRSSKGERGPAAIYGYDSFVQDHAIQSFWPVLIEADRRALKHAVRQVGGQDVIDVYKASDAAQFVGKKLDDVLEWTRFQLSEYESIINVLTDTESPLHSVLYSSRGLQRHDGEGEDDQGNAQQG